MRLKILHPGSVFALIYAGCRVTRAFSDRKPGMHAGGGSGGGGDGLFLLLALILGPDARTRNNGATHAHT
jgi:hypothetical protein